MKRKILLLGSQMAIAGAQRVLLDQATWLRQQGWEVETAFFYDRDGLKETWQKEYAFPVHDLQGRCRGAGKLENSRRTLTACWRLFRLLRKGNFSAIETFTHHSNLIGIPLAWLVGVKRRVASHHVRFKSLTNFQIFIHTKMINAGFASCIVAVSEGVHQDALQEGIHPEKIVVIPNGIHLPPVDPEAKKSVCTELGLPLDAQIILSAGRLVYAKAHTLLVQSAPSVLERFPQARFLIAGGGELYGELANEIQERGLEGCIQLLGVRTDIYRLMAAADIFAMPSRTEGMPMALLEAMGMGKAVITSAVGGMKELIEDGVTGLLVPPEDDLRLGDAILRFLDNPDLRIGMGKKAQEMILERYSLEKSCRAYEKLFVE